MSATSAAAIAAGGNLAGGFLGGLFGRKSEQRAREFAVWQMSNAHQLEVNDLKAAGLNPILSAGGNGASAGVSIGSSPDFNDFGSDSVSAFNSAKAMDIASKNSSIAQQNADSQSAHVRNEQAAVDTQKLLAVSEIAKNDVGVQQSLQALEQSKRRFELEIQYLPKSYDAQLRKINADISVARSQVAALAAQVDYYSSMTGKTRMEALNEMERNGLISAQKREVIARTGLLNSQRERQEQENYSNELSSRIEGNPITAGAYGTAKSIGHSLPTALGLFGLIHGMQSPPTSVTPLPFNSSRPQIWTPGAPRNFK